MTRLLNIALLIVAAALAFAAVACDDDGTPAQETPAARSTIESTLAGDLTVFAAASLTEVLEEAAEGFEAAHPGVDVEFNFAGSPTLVTQLSEGARADVLVTADQANMDRALDNSVVNDAGALFAQNRLVIIVPADNPAGIETPQDLSADGVKLVLALAEVPVGRYARESLAKMAADPAFGDGFDEATLTNVVSEEPNVKAVVTKVQLGEADAGIVYASDVTDDIASDVAVIDIEDAFNVIAEYPIALTAATNNREVAEAFIEFLLSDEGQAILEENGFIGIE